MRSGSRISNWGADAFCPGTINCNGIEANTKSKGATAASLGNGYVMALSLLMQVKTREERVFSNLGCRSGGKRNPYSLRCGY